MTESKSNWNQLLADETALLQELAVAAAKTRAAALRTQDLTDLVEAQAAICEQLEGFRARRDAVLETRGYPPRDFLIAVLDETPAAERAQVSDRFGAFVAAAEAAQREIDVNREFFGVALASLEEVLDGEPSPTYDNRPRQPDPLVLSFST